MVNNSNETCKRSQFFLIRTQVFLSAIIAVFWFYLFSCAFPAIIAACAISLVNTIRWHIVVMVGIQFNLRSLA